MEFLDETSIEVKNIDDVTTFFFVHCLDLGSR
jgi:hypothetical protein